MTLISDLAILVLMRINQVAKKKTARFAHFIPLILKEEIYELSEKHIPKPNKSVFLQYIMELGIEYYEKGRKPRRIYSSDVDVQLGHTISAEVIDKFNELSDGHRPNTIRKHFLTYILSLGIEHYRFLYDEYGIRKE